MQAGLQVRTILMHAAGFRRLTINTPGQAIWALV